MNNSSASPHEQSLAELTDYQRGILEGLARAMKINSDLEFQQLYAGTSEVPNSNCIHPEQRATRLALHATLGQALRTAYFLVRGRAGE